MSGIGPSEKGRRKSLDAEVNLVPFIDLLSMCICFLLMTAVWMEIGAVQVKQLVGTEAPASGPDSYEMDLKFLSREKIEVSIKKPGHGSQKFGVQASTGEERLSLLSKAVATLPFAKLISVARLTTKTGVSYGELISVMDVLRKGGIVNLGIVPVKE